MRPHIFAAIAFITVALFGQPALREVTAEPGSGQQPARQRDNMRFRGMDRNNDGRITRDEWRGSDRAFRNNDWNGDGVLSGEEVRPGARRRAEQRDAGDPFYDWTDEGFQSLDHDRDGRITRDEWHHDAASFTRADRDRDQVLTRAEFLGDSGAVGTTGRRALGGTVAVDAQTRWTDSGFDVDVDDTLVFTADGRVTLSTYGNDAANASGSVTGRRAEQAPLRDRPAGAVIARIGEHEPFFVGARHTVHRAPYSGRLYLGVNDDHLGDNAGGFRVTVEIRPASR